MAVIEAAKSVEISSSKEGRFEPVPDELSRLRREVRRLRAVDQFVRQKEQTLHLIFESASDAIVTIDGDGRILHANAGLARVFGHSPRDVLDQSITMLIPEEHREAHATGLKRFIRTGRRRQEWTGLRLRGLHRDGHEFPVEVSFGAMKLPDGDFRFTGIMRDITRSVERETSEREQLSELARRQRFLSVNEMATGLAHELNQPLQAICLQADAAVASLRTTSGTSEGLQASLTEIAYQAERASRIVRSVRSMVQHREPTREMTSIETLLKTVLPLCEHYAARIGVRVTTRLSRNLPAVFVEPVQVEQVIVNLVQNAVDAMGSAERDRREIEISAACSAEETVSTSRSQMVQVSVLDHGTGLPAGNPERLFDSFVTTKAEGIGLGLAICRTIIDDHGGRIRAESHDDGTVFSFTLPISEPGAEARDA